MRLASSEPRWCVIRNIRFVRRKAFEVTINRQRLDCFVYHVVVITTVNVALFVQLLDHLGLKPAEALRTRSSSVTLFTSLLVFCFTKQDAASAARLNRAELTNFSDEVVVMTLSNFSCLTLNFCIDIKGIIAVCVSVLFSSVWQPRLQA